MNITLVGRVQGWCVGHHLPRGWNRQRHPAACRPKEEVRCADRSKMEGPDDVALQVHSLPESYMCFPLAILEAVQLISPSNYHFFQA